MFLIDGRPYSLAMQPLNFAAAAQIVGPELNHNTRCGHLQWVWLNFHRNVYEGLNLLVLPALNHLMAIHSKSAIVEAAEQLAFEARVNKVPLASSAITKKAQENLFNRMSWPPEQQREVLRPAIDEIARSVESGGTSLYSIIRSVYRSVLIQKYIAFEAMAEELWEKALNVHPHDLSNVTFPERDKKGFLPEKLQEMGFDLRDKMGTLLKSKFRFEVLKEVRLAYAGAFSTDGGEVYRAINDQRLDVIAILRNVFVHANGKLDAAFMEQSKSVAGLGAIRVLDEGAKVPLDGLLLKQVVEGCIEAGCALIRAVDNWMMANPYTLRAEREVEERPN